MADIYFDSSVGAGDGRWGSVANWWLDADSTIPANRLPGAGDQEVDAEIKRFKELQKKAAARKKIFGG